MTIENICLQRPRDTRLPKYVQLADQVEEWITRQSIPVGTKLPSDRKLAKIFNVTSVTISRSFQILAEKGIINRRVGAGTFVASEPGGAFRPLRIGLFCFEFPTPEDYYYGEALNAFNSFWNKHKGNVLTLALEASEYRAAIDEYELDGAMVLCPSKEYIPYIAELRAENFPIVSVGIKFTDPELDNCSFGTNHRETVRKAVKRLIDLGHRRIGLIYRDEGVSVAEERLAGYQQGMWDAQNPVNPEWIIATKPGEAMLDVGRVVKMIRQEKPTAFLIACYKQIIPFYSLMAREGFRIPEDCSVVAFDDPEYASQLHPPLTVYSQPVESFSRAAASLLLAWIKGNNASQASPCDQVKLVERGSCISLNHNLEDK